MKSLISTISISRKRILRATWARDTINKAVDNIMCYIMFSGNSMKFTEYWQQVSRIANSDRTSKMKIAYDFYDYDGDGKIWIDDIMNMIRNLRPTDWLLMEDWQVLIRQLKLKNYQDISLHKKEKITAKRLLHINSRWDNRQESRTNFDDILFHKNEGINSLSW